MDGEMRVRAAVRPLVFVASLLGALSCAPGAWATPSTKTGWLDPLPLLSQVMISNLEADRWCSGTAVSQHQVLTAAHCIHEQDSSMLVYSQDAKTPHMSVRIMLLQDLDVALLILPPSVFLPSVAPVSKKVPEPGQILLVAGYGCYLPQLDVRPVVFMGLDSQGDMVLSGAVCAGDSGGGILTMSGDVVGVIRGRHAGGKPIGWGVALKPEWFK